MTEANQTANSARTKALLAVLVAGTIGIIIFLFVHLSSSGTPQIGAKPAAAACTGGSDKCMPELSYVDTMGFSYTPNNLAGKVVVINFWATWCKPCLSEIPDLSRVAEKYKDRGVVVLGVLTSDNPDQQELLNFASDHEMTFPIVRATGDILSQFDTSGLPTTYIFDRTGRRVYGRAGALTASKLTSILDPLL